MTTRPIAAQAAVSMPRSTGPSRSMAPGVGLVATPRMFDRGRLALLGWHCPSARPAGRVRSVDARPRQHRRRRRCSGTGCAGTRRRRSALGGFAGRRRAPAWCAATAPTRQGRGRRRPAGRRPAARPRRDRRPSSADDVAVDQPHAVLGVQAAIHLGDLGAQDALSGRGRSEMSVDVMAEQLSEARPPLPIQPPPTTAILRPSAACAAPVRIGRRAQVAHAGEIRRVAASWRGARRSRGATVVGQVGAVVQVQADAANGSSVTARRPDHSSTSCAS